MQIIPSATTATLKGFLAASVTPGSAVITDGLASYPGASADYAHHVHVVNRSGHQAHELLPAVHLVASLAKRWIAATHQGGLEPDHLGAYLDEFAFRFNRRYAGAPGVIFCRLLHAMVQAPPAGYRALALGPTPKPYRQLLPQDRTRPLERWPWRIWTNHGGGSIKWIANFYLGTLDF